MSELLAALARTSVQGGIVLLVVGLVCRAFHRLSADMRCWLWRLAYVKCLAGFFLAVTFAVPILPAALPTVPSTRPSARTADAVLPVSAESAPRRETSPSDAENTPPVVVTPSVAAPLIHVSAAPVHPASWANVVALLYGAGLTACILQLLLAGHRAWALVRRATPVSHPGMSALLARFGRISAPRLARSAEITSPLIAFGTILLPAVPDADEPLLLAHEFCHIERRDLAWEWLGIATQTLLWCHPLVWLARREERLAREQAADALAVAITAAAPADYARALLQVSLRHCGRTPALTVGAVAGGSRLRRRLEALARPALSRRYGISMGVVAGVIVAAALVPWRAVAKTQTEPTGDVTAASAPAAGEAAHIDPAGMALLKKVQTTMLGLKSYRAECWRTLTWGPESSGYTRPPENDMSTLTAVKPNLMRYDVWDMTVGPKGTWTRDQAAPEGTTVCDGATTWIQSGKTYSVRHNVDDRHNVDEGAFGTYLRPWNGFFSGDQSEYSRLEAFRKISKNIEVRCDGSATVDGVPCEKVFVDTKWPFMEDREDQVREDRDTFYISADGFVRRKTERISFGSVLFRDAVLRNIQTNFTVADRAATFSYKAPAGVRREDDELTTIVGRVTDTSGNPFANVEVAGYTKHTRTNGNGYYILPAQPGPDFVRVESVAGKKVTAHWSGPPAIANFALAHCKIIRIAGQVVDDHGAPVPNRYVETLGSNYAGWARTDDTGNFSWTRLVNLGHPITLYAYRGDEGVEATLDPKADKPLLLRLSAASVGHITGQITDSAGKPLPETSIVFMRKFTGHSELSRTDANGRFSIETRPGLPTYLSLHCQGYGNRTVGASGPVVEFLEASKLPKEIVAQAGQTIDFGRIVLARGSDTATGLLLDPSGKPLASTLIFLATRGGEWKVKTDAQGRFVLTDLPRGEQCTIAVFVLPARVMWVRRGLTVGNMGAVRLVAEPWPH